jgi:cytochrome P450
MPEPFAFQPLDPATRRDPFALYARGRREHPVFEHAGLPLRILSVFRHADVQAILRDSDSFSNVFQLAQVAP